MALSCYIEDRFSDDLIRAETCPDCVVCGAPGISIYKGLTDRFYGVAGRWNWLRCSGSQCATLWLSPMPLEADIWKAYRSYYTHDLDRVADPIEPLSGAARRARHSIKRAYVAAQLGYGDHPATWREQMLSCVAYLDPTRRADTDFPIKSLPIGTRGRLLDLGCGNGELLGRMTSLGWHAEGIDIDAAAVEVARRCGFNARAGSLYGQKFPDASFDAVVMSHVIEHVHRPLALLAEVRRILKRGRRLVIATPNARSLGHRWLHSRWPFLDPPRHLQIFTPHSLKSLVLAAGFGIVSTCTEVRTAAAMLPRIEGSRILGRLFEYGENLALHFDRDAGEEITLVAVR